MTQKGKTVLIDGILYSAIALFTFSEAYFSGEEAYKYINPWVLFWIKYTIGSTGAVAAAVKMYRSTAFADHQRENGALDNPPKPDKPTSPTA